MFFAEDIGYAYRYKWRKKPCIYIYILNWMIKANTFVKCGNATINSGVDYKIIAFLNIKNK